ncbi:histidine phosphatase family protein [Streptomyces sp. SID13031]|uniref:histidine phosphatase family protein n=1 Tax=Streptomyces sp. SID13031 TaxID=2706046 RepID=UPI0013CB744F|nr:histidine phosphatase family protein [Streptomyces sp. SID13031]NEA36486.1 histidine phosphatase family protein [Streptomyces sp. SID13031]
MTSLTLVAHALTPALRGLVLGGDASPDPSGVEAARELKIVADEVYSGPEIAALRTADALGLSPVVVPALRDRDYGDWTGRELEELLEASPGTVATWLERPHTAPPGGESENDVITRVADWLGDLTQSGPSSGSLGGSDSGPGSGSVDGGGRGQADRRTVAAVVHPAVVRAAVLYVLDAPAESLRHVDVRPLSVVRLSAHAGSWSLTFG